MKPAEDCGVVRIAYAVDQSFALPLTVSLFSLLENFSPHRSLELYVLHDVFPAGQLERIRDSIASFLRPGITLNFLKYDPAKLAGLRVTLHFSPANYARFLLAELLPGALEKIIYLDADTLVLDDVSALYDLDASAHPLLLAPDWTGTLSHPLLGMPEDLAAWGASPGDRSYNTGVLLMNLQMWRTERLSEKFFNLARAHPELLFIADQNLINLFLHGRIGELDPRWNKQTVYRKVRDGSWDMPYAKLAWDPPRIVHFVSEEKPWLPGCEVPERELYYEFWRKTKFPFARPAEA